MNLRGNATHNLTTANSTDPKNSHIKGNTPTACTSEARHYFDSASTGISMTPTEMLSHNADPDNQNKTSATEIPFNIISTEDQQFVNEPHKSYAVNSAVTTTYNALPANSINNI
mmetsp:Transcript_146900/g.256485  ORF Transcript_146900/g.256485 Transcript_146900/m.256485 type:complete len:114 (-) Transcript_146900:211-552(-)